MTRAMQTFLNPMPTPTKTQPPAANSPFADIADINEAHWHYTGTPDESQTALEISFPGRRVSIQLDRQIKLVCASHAALVAALEHALADLEDLNLGRATIEQVCGIIPEIRNALKAAKESQP